MRMQFMIMLALVTEDSCAEPGRGRGNNQLEILILFRTLTVTHSLYLLHYAPSDEVFVLNLRRPTEK
jgi:hypothetical protein